MSKAYMIMAAQNLVGAVPGDVQGLPAAPEGGQLHHRPGDGEDGTPPSAAPATERTVAAHGSQPPASRLPARPSGAGARTGENLFRGLVEASPIPMLVITADCAGRVLLMNARFKQTFGYTEADIPEVSAWWPRAYPDPGYRARIRRTWIEAMATAERRGLSSHRAPVAARVTCGTAASATSRCT